MSEVNTSQVVRYTCPNCRVKFTSDTLDAFGDHIQNCPRRENHEFPKYMVVVAEPKSGYSRRSFQDLSQVAMYFNSGFLQVRIGRRVLEEDFSLRPIVDAERHLISQIADDIDASK